MCVVWGVGIGECRQVASCYLIYYLCSMKANSNKYIDVDILPANAVTVKQYADSLGISTAYVYKQVKQNTNKFKIVKFQTINFIVPN